MGQVFFVFEKISLEKDRETFGFYQDIFRHFNHCHFSWHIDEQFRIFILSSRFTEFFVWAKLLKKRKFYFNFFKIHFFGNFALYFFICRKR